MVKPQFEVGKDQVGAGGVVSDFEGRTDGLTGQEIVCANEHLHPQMIKILKDVKV